MLKNCNFFSSFFLYFFLKFSCWCFSRSKYSTIALRNIDRINAKTFDVYFCSENASSFISTEVIHVRSGEITSFNFRTILAHFSISGFSRAHPIKILYRLLSPCWVRSRTVLHLDFLQFSLISTCWPVQYGWTCKEEKLRRHSSPSHRDIFSAG